MKKQSLNPSSIAPLAFISVGYVLIGAVVATLAFNGTDSVERQSAVNPTTEYCEMTQIYMATDGEYGWPDYKNISKHCEWNKGNAQRNVSCFQPRRSSSLC